MIKKLFKILLIVSLIIVIAILYLSFFGIKTSKFNNQIIKNVSKINKEINLKLNDVNYLLNLYNFTINIKTKNPLILLENKSYGIKSIQTNISLNSLVNDQFSIDDLKIITKEIKLNDIIMLARIFQNSPQLLILNTVIKDGSVTANIDLNFDKNGKIKENYKIEGFVKKTKINTFDQFKLQDLNFNFSIGKNIYLLKKVNMQIDDIKIVSSKIEINKKKKIIFS